MTETVHILRCAYCKKPFDYVPTDEDKCRPGAPHQICDDCARALTEGEHNEYISDDT
jgi:hypothetical protein